MGYGVRLRLAKQESDSAGTTRTELQISRTSGFWIPEALSKKKNCWKGNLRERRSNGTRIWDTIYDYEAEERRKQQSKIDEVVIPQNASHIIVRSYLQHYGYEETLSLFDIAVKNSAPPINIPSEDGDNMFDISERKKLREVIRSGNIDDALSKLKGCYHDIFEDNKSAICFLLHCQKFIELIRENKPEDAMWYAKSKLGEFNNEPQFDDLVKDCVALLAYVEPQKSSVGYLLGDCQREIVADAVNAMILARDPSKKDVVVESCLHTRLEKLLRQLSACFALKRSLNGDEGEAFNLSKFLSSTGN